MPLLSLTAAALFIGRACERERNPVVRINLDNPVICFLNRVFDTVVAVTLGILLCVPVITAGPALTAMYRTLMDVASDQCGSVFKSFFCAFRDDLSQSIPLGLLLMVIGTVIAADLWVCWGFQHEPSAVVSVMRGLTFACSLLFFAWGSYLLPGLAQFHVTNRQAIRNAAVWAVKKPFITLSLVLCKFAAVSAMILMWYFCFPVLWILGYIEAALLNKAFGVRSDPNPEPEHQEIYYE